MRVDAFQIHVGDAVVRHVVLDAGARLLRAHPHRGPAGMLGARLGLAEDALKGYLAKAVDMAARRASRRRRRDRRAEVRQLGQAIAESRDRRCLSMTSAEELDMGIQNPPQTLKPFFMTLLPSLLTCFGGHTTRFWSR